MPRDPERVLRDLDDDLLAERYATPPVTEFGQRDRDLADLADANEATYEDRLLRKRRRALP